MKYNWSLESWGADYPPENAGDIISAANEKISEYAATHSDEDTREYSAMLWDRYCTTGKI